MDVQSTYTRRFISSTVLPIDGRDMLGLFLGCLLYRHPFKQVNFK